MSLILDRKPLAATEIPAPLQRNVDPASPLPMKMMAARGMVPAPPDQLIKVLYQLHLDPEEGVRQAAAKYVADLPEAILGNVVQNLALAVVLDWIADLRQDIVLQAVLLNRHAEDVTVARLAGSVDAGLCEVIANNQVRVLRSPVIIEQLYQNPNARMATVDKLIDLAERNKVDLSGLAAIKSAMEMARAAEARDASPGIAEDAFAAILKSEVAKAADDKVRAMKMDADDSLTRSQRDRMREEEDDEDEKRAVTGTIASQIAGMSIAQKVRLATVGSKEAINVLVRDANKLVHMAAIRSPRLQPSDIRKMASNKSMPDGVIKFIATNRDWTRHYDIMSALVQNPKTPMTDVMAFLNHLRVQELRDIARSRNVPAQVARMAKSLMEKRAGK